MDYFMDKFMDFFYGNFMASLVPVSNFEVKTLPAPYAADPSAVQFGA